MGPGTRGILADLKELLIAKAMSPAGYLTGVADLKLLESDCHDLKGLCRGCAARGILGGYLVRAVDVQ